MANYPSSLPSLSNPGSTDKLNSPDHAAQHSNANDEIEAIATELGTDVAGGKTDLKTYLAVEHNTAGLHTSITGPLTLGSGTVTTLVVTSATIGTCTITSGTVSTLTATSATVANIKVTGTVSGLTSAIEYIIDGGGAVISAGSATAIGFVEVPFKCVISQCSLLACQTGSVKVDIWKDTYANFPPTDADTITGGNEPEIANSTKDQDSTLTDWTTAVSAGDILGFAVDSCGTIERLTVSLQVTRTV